LNLANAELALERANNGLALAKVALNQAMGAEGSIDYDVAMPEAMSLPEETQAPDALMGDALAARPEMTRIGAQLRAQDGARKIARSGYFPSLLALANLSGTDVTDSKNGDFPWGFNWYLGLGLSWNLYAGSLNQHQVEEAAANAAVLEAQRDGLRQS